MSKNKRFPSAANVSVKKAVNAAQNPGAPAPEAPKAPDAPAVKGSTQSLVQVEYKKDNHHILGMGAHAIRKGVNHLPKHVWEEAKSHPAIQHMIKSGDLVDLSTPFDEPMEDERASEDQSQLPDTVGTADGTFRTDPIIGGGEPVKEGA